MNVQRACGLLGYSKQAYYKRLQYKEEQAFNEYLIVALILQKRQLWKKGSGRNLLACLRPDFEKHRIKIGRDKFFEILRRHGLLIRRKNKRAITTNSYHHFHRYPNRIKDLTPQRPNQIWVSDITYVWIRQQACFLYLFLITDMYSRKVIGYQISEDLKANGAVEALRMAINQAGSLNLERTIHHSDRGIQYCSKLYIELLTNYNITISMTEKSDPLENPIAERINRTIKEEFMDDYKSGYLSIAVANKQLLRSINFYNQVRPHRSIEMLTPSQAHTKEGKLVRKWKTYYKKKS